jgi:hypothetical protein
LSYRDDELKAAASELIQGTVSFKRDVLGPRDARSSFDEIRELVNSALLYEPDSVFYLIFIASQALQKIVNDEVDTLAELLDAVDDLLKPNKPIEDVASVAEASVALSALDGAIARSGRIGQTEYSRYLKAIERAKRTFGSVTKLTFTPRGSSQAVTDIVRPAAQARKDTTAHFGTLKTQHAVMLERVSNLLTAYRSFNLDELATLVSRTQVSRAQGQMNRLHEQLKDLPPAERTGLAREALLRVLTNRSVVTAMTSAPTPGGVKLEQRRGAAATYRLVASGTGSAPTLEGAISAPYPLELDATQNLTLTLNDALPDLDLNLLPVGDSFLDGITSAQLKGSRSGPFQIAADVLLPLVIHSREIAPAGTFGLTATSNLFHMIVDGVSYEVTLPTGAGSTVAAVAGAIDVAIPTITATEEAGLTPTFTRMQIVYSNGSPPVRYSERYMHVLEGALNAVLGPYLVGGMTPPFGSTPGYTAFSSGWDDNTELKIKPNDDTGEETINLTVGIWTGDPATSYRRTATQIEIDINGQASGFTASLIDQLIVLTSTLKGEGSILTVVSDGMYSGAPKPDTGTPSFKGAETLGFYEGQEDRRRDVDGRVIINLLNEDTTFASEAQAKLVYTEFTRQRRATTHASLNHCIEYNVEANPASDWPPASELKLQVLTGDNSGVYKIGGWSWLTGTFTLQLSRDLRHQDTAVLHEIVIYREVIQIASLDSSVDGLLEAKDSAINPARATLGLPIGAVRGGVSKIYIEYNDPQVGWVPADLRQRLLKIGDQLKRLDTNANVTKVTSVVEAVDGLLTISPQVDPLLSLDTTQGFSIQSISYLNYVAFEMLLTAWWDNISPFGDEDLEYLDRLLSPVLLVKATAPRVSAVYIAVEDLRNRLTGAGSLLEILQSFSVTKIFQVDQALQSLLEQGHNRARALLIKGAIATYMETTKEDSSFGKAVMKATSAVAIQDVNEPTNLNRHLSEDYERVAAEWYDDKDPLHDFSDVEGDLDEPAALDFWEGID